MRDPPRGRKGKVAAARAFDGATDLCQLAAMSLSRFYLPADHWQPPQFTLTGDEAQHCARVLRKAAGDRVELFDGTGRVAEAVLTEVGKHAVRAELVREHPAAVPARAIHLLPALIKGEPFEWLLEKAVELGAASVQPLLTERTVVHLDGEHLDKKLAKWRRHMIESAKQCHTPFVPRLEPPRPLAQVIAAQPAAALKILPSLSEHRRSLHGIAAGADGACIAIGPEGDFTAAEEAFAQSHGFVPVTLGPLILRAETAALTALAVLAHELRR